jgi:lauroyl/myristoyl acyltransferase
MTMFTFGLIIGFLLCFFICLLLVYLIPEKAIKFAAKRGARLERKLGTSTFIVLRSLAEKL